MHDIPLAACKAADYPVAVIPFTPWPKIPRLSRDVIVTEKIDGTNASIYIGEDGTFLVGSRTRWITPKDDNYGFANWAHANKKELLKLGPGQHFGEWWGKGIQRNYGMTERRFSLFNTRRWEKRSRVTGWDVIDTLSGLPGPACCDVVPILYAGSFDMPRIQACIDRLEMNGSSAASGFMNPEGIVVFHTAAQHCFKKTIKDDAKPKGQSE
jgi:hypothetical protein